MASLTEIIRTYRADILDRWTKDAQKAAAAQGLERTAFQHVIPAYLSSLADAADDLGQYGGRRREHVESHLSSRLRQGFELAEIIEAFALLGRCIAATWNSDGGVEPPSYIEVEKLFRELHLTSVAMAEMFTRHMMEDEQIEKRFLRLIQEVASAAFEKSAPALEMQLEEVLVLVMEAMGSQSAALLLYIPMTESLETKASVGASGENFEHYVPLAGIGS